MLDEDNCRYLHKGRIISLSKKETRMLYFLIYYKDKVALYEPLVEFVFNQKHDEYTHDCMLVMIFKLKRKMQGIIEIKNHCFKGWKIKYIGE